MAKKQVEVCDKKSVLESLGDLNTEQLRSLIQEAEAKIRKFEIKNKAERILDFKSSEFAKSHKVKLKELKAKFKGIERKPKFSVNISFYLSVSLNDDFESLVLNRFSEFYSMKVKAGKVSGNYLTKEQLYQAQESVEEYAEDMCDDGIRNLFPQAILHADAVTEEAEAIRLEYYQELCKHGLEIHDVK